MVFISISLKVYLPSSKLHIILNLHLLVFFTMAEIERLFVSYLSAKSGSQKEGKIPKYCGFFGQPKQSAADWSPTGLNWDVNTNSGICVMNDILE